MTKEEFRELRKRAQHPLARGGSHRRKLDALIWGKLITKERKEQGFSQAKLAEETNISQATLSRIERGATELADWQLREIKIVLFGDDADGIAQANKLDEKLILALDIAIAIIDSDLPEDAGWGRDAQEQVERLSKYGGLGAIATLAVIPKE
jgi:transcriptional regulator with XRE-family HTH domain